MKFSVSAVRGNSSITSTSEGVNICFHDEDNIKYKIAMINIIRMNYEYAFMKYNDDFKAEKVQEYLCVREASRVLQEEGYNIMMEII